MNKKLTELTEATEIKNEDLLMVIQGGENKKAQAGIILDKVNENAEEIDRINNKSILVACTNDVGTSLGVSNTEVALNLNTISIQKGDNLTLENGAIKCLKDGIIFANASVRLYGGEPAMNKSVAAVIVNDTDNSRGKYIGNIPYASWYISPRISGYIQVKTGDLIRLKVSSSDENVAIETWGAATFLSVEYID